VQFRTMQWQTYRSVDKIAPTLLLLSGDFA
jgi:hypothetical protein